MVTDKKVLKHMIDVASLRVEADTAIIHANVVDVYNHEILKDKTILIADGFIVGFGDNKTKVKAKNIIDAEHQFVLPGFINGHVHIESSHLSPEMFASAVVPHGTTTVIADPHEICNVCGLDGLKYMYDSTENIPLSVFFMVPSCVPATPFEHAGAVIKSDDIKTCIDLPRVLGLGELMDYPGTINADSEILNKILVSNKANKVVDGHSPTFLASSLDAYITAGPFTDHECANKEELRERTSKGMYVLLREGSACHDTKNLAKGVDEHNARLCMLCTDDRQPSSIFKEGDLDNNIRLLNESGIDPITAIQIATLNAATAHNLRDRGAIAPGKRADIVIAKNLEYPNPSLVLVNGEVVAKNGKYLKEIKVKVPKNVKGKVNIGSFTKDKLILPLKSNKVHVIGIIEGSVVTKDEREEVKTDSKGNFVYDPKKDILKIAVVERHNGTGNVGVGLIKGYGLKTGAVALSIAHDSHNFIVVGQNDDDMYTAIKHLEKIGGGIVLVNNGKVIGELEHEIAGLMSAKLNVKEMTLSLEKLHKIANDTLKVSKNVDPIMTLCFMALPVIPELKITDMGLFDVVHFKPIKIEA